MLDLTRVGHVQSTTWETSSYGDRDPGPRGQNREARKPKKSSSMEGEDTDGTGSSLAESVRTASAPEGLDPPGPDPRGGVGQGPQPRARWGARCGAAFPMGTGLTVARRVAMRYKTPTTGLWGGAPHTHTTVPYSPAKVFLGTQDGGFGMHNAEKCCLGSGVAPPKMVVRVGRGEVSVGPVE